MKLFVCVVSKCPGSFVHMHRLLKEHGGSVVECLTLDRVVAGASLAEGTVLCP